MPPHPHAAGPAGERDPTTGVSEERSLLHIPIVLSFNLFLVHALSTSTIQAFIYGGPPLSTTIPHTKRSRMRIKTPQDIQNRKVRKNAQSRHRAARLRDKVESIKSKAETTLTGELAEEEARLYNVVEERRSRKNNRSRERALEKKAELDRIMATPENQRTNEEVEILNVASTAKKRKNEGDRLRREKLKKMGLKQKPPNMTIQSRPRKPLSGENILPYGSAPPGLAGIPGDGGLQVIPPPGAGGPMAPPGLPPPGADTYQYPPPQPHPHAYPPPNPYYAEPPPMKEESGEVDHSDNNHERPDSEEQEQEVSELLLQDHHHDVDEEDDAHHHDVDSEEDDIAGTIEC